MDTIFALSTASGKAGVAVIRVSGPRAFDLCRAIAGSVPEPRHATLRPMRAKGEVIDHALVLTFEEGHSFTGEKVVEFQMHGSHACVSSLSDVLLGFADVRLAEPGEFTRRALENDQLDLAQVEGLADLLEAETEAQRRQAIRVLSGDLGNLAERWRVSLIRAMALLEVTIDFADEDVPVDVIPEVGALLQDVIAEIAGEIEGVDFAERVRSGFEVAIVGAPNVGKSTLLNALAGRDAAITSEFAGTTRDVIEVRMDLDGLPVTILDTAGLRDTDDHVEAIGIQRALERAEAADLRVFLCERDGEFSGQSRSGDIVLMAKCDLHDTKDNGVSGLTGEGVSDLVRRITVSLVARGTATGVATRFRHKVALKNGVEALTRAHGFVLEGCDATEIIAEEVRSAIHALNALVGRVDVENILDEIFSSFCLGK